MPCGWSIGTSPVNVNSRLIKMNISILTRAFVAGLWISKCLWIALWSFANIEKGPVWKIEEACCLIHVRSSTRSRVIACPSSKSYVLIAFKSYFQQLLSRMIQINLFVPKKCLTDTDAACSMLHWFYIIAQKTQRE